MKRPFVIAVDFDGTLCDHRFPGMGEPHWDVIKALIKLRAAGHKLILWTCREGDNLTAALQWSHQHGLDFDAVNENLTESIRACGGADPRKIFADIYLDDLSCKSDDLLRMVGV